MSLNLHSTLFSSSRSSAQTINHQYTHHEAQNTHTGTPFLLKYFHSQSGTKGSIACGDAELAYNLPSAFHGNLTKNSIDMEVDTLGSRALFSCTECLIHFLWHWIPPNNWPKSFAATYRTETVIIRRHMGTGSKPGLGSRAPLWKMLAMSPSWISEHRRFPRRTRAYQECGIWGNYSWVGFVEGLLLGFWSGWEDYQLWVPTDLSNQTSYHCILTITSCQVILLRLDILEAFLKSVIHLRISTGPA